MNFLRNFCINIIGNWIQSQDMRANLEDVGLLDLNLANRIY